MFLSTILLNHPSPINCVLHINLDTSDVRMQHLCITASKYGELYRTFCDIRNTQYVVDFSRHTSAKMTTCGVNFRLYQNMSNFMMNYKSV